jgi:hypothetical protein
VTPAKPALPAPRPGGANRPYPMSCRIKQQLPYFALAGTSKATSAG